MAWGRIVFIANRVDRGVLRGLAVSDPTLASVADDPVAGVEDIQVEVRRALTGGEVHSRETVVPGAMSTA